MRVPKVFVSPVTLMKKQIIPLDRHGFTTDVLTL